MLSSISQSVNDSALNQNEKLRLRDFMNVAKSLYVWPIRIFPSIMIGCVTVCDSAISLVTEVNNSCNIKAASYRLFTCLLFV